MGYGKIDLTKFLPENLSINLRAGFCAELFTKATKSMGSVAALAMDLGVHPRSIKRWRNRVSWPTLAFLWKVADIARVPKRELYENTISITAKRKSNAIPLTRELTVDEKFAEWFGLLKGDGSIRKALYNVAFSNENPELHRFFMRIAIERFKVPQNLFYLSLRVPDSIRLNKNELNSQWSRKLGLSTRKIKVYTKPSLGIVADLFISSAALAWMIIAAEKEIKKIIDRSSPKVKGAYLRGILAAEGTVYPPKHVVRITMKNEKEITFVYKILRELGIICSKRFYRERGQWTIFIFGKANLERLLKNGGFGLNLKRNVLLKKLLGSYKELHLPLRTRYTQVRAEIRKRGVVTINHLMKSLTISHERARQLLYQLVKGGELSVDKSRRPHIFSFRTCQSSISASTIPILRPECAQPMLVQLRSRG